ncbi:MAG: permease [Aristaeellaceae bacterium]
MGDVLRREAIYLWYYLSVQTEQILPYWILGIVLGSVISVFGKGKIHAAFQSLCNRRWGVLGLIPASLLGIASPLCMYGTIPLAASFSRHGIKDDYLAAFMMSSILLNPQLILYSAALGHEALWIRVLSCFVCGVIAGSLIRYLFRSKPFFDFTGFAEPVSRDVHPNPMMRLVCNIGRNFRATGLWFFLGILLTALYQRYVPREWAQNLFGKENGFGVLMAASIGVPMYMCGGGTIPLLQEWLWNGMTMGSAAAFMITGPATKLTNLGAVKAVLGTKHFLLYVAFCIVFATGTGLLIDWIL